MCLWKEVGSLDEPVITTLMTPLSSSSECHSGFRRMISSYKSTQFDDSSLQSFLCLSSLVDVFQSVG